VGQAPECRYFPITNITATFATMDQLQSWNGCTDPMPTSMVRGMGGKTAVVLTRMGYGV
jgi:hypothetical protein